MSQNQKQPIVKAHIISCAMEISLHSTFALAANNLDYRQYTVELRLLGINKRRKVFMSTNIIDFMD